MQKLKANEITHITENIIHVLAQNRISSILEFLQADVTKLITVTKLNLSQILNARNEIFSKFSAPIKNGIPLLDKRHKALKTGIENLDSMLDGGLPVGTITELCGLADSGKTQLCFQICINCLKSNNCTVLYIDTKGDFSAVRVQKILDTAGFSNKEMADIMYRMRVVRVWTMEETIELLQSLKNKRILIENLALIIMDSLPCLMFQFLGDDNKIGLSMLNILVNYSRYICTEMGICIICVNIQTRWVDQDVADFEDDGESSNVSKEMFVEKRNRCLGKYWQNIPNLVLLLDKLQCSGDDTSIEVAVSILKCNILSNVLQQHTLLINDKGVT